MILFQAARDAIARLWFAEQTDFMLPSQTAIDPVLNHRPTIPGETEALP